MKNKKKNPTPISIEKCKKVNRWRMLPISKLPDNAPVIAIQEFLSKDMALFHLVEYCLVPDFEHPDFQNP